MKCPKFASSKAAKIERANVATQLSAIWAENGLAHARTFAADEFAAIFACRDGRYSVSILGLTVEHVGSASAALRRWMRLTVTGAHGYHAAPSSPNCMVRSLSVIQHRKGAAYNRERDERESTGSIAILDVVDQ